MWTRTTSTTDNRVRVCLWHCHCVSTPVKILMWRADFVYLEPTRRSRCQCAHLLFYISCPIMKQETFSRQKQRAGGILMCPNWPTDFHQHVSYDWKCIRGIYILYCTQCSEPKSHLEIHSRLRSFISFGAYYFSVVNLLYLWSCGRY